MSRPLSQKLGIIMCVTILTGWLATPASKADVFMITIDNLSPNVLTPIPVITHDGGFDLFDEGAAASPQLERLAEDGDYTGVESQAQAAMGAAVLDVQVAGMAPIPPGGFATVTIEADLAHPWLSYASMFALSNDAFIGAAAGDGAINLFPGGLPLSGEILVQPSEVWDAGTEVNDELAAHVPGLGAAVDAGTPQNGSIMMGHPGIQGTADVPLANDWTGGPVARITVVPEPSALTLITIAMFGFLWLTGRKRR